MIRRNNEQGTPAAFHALFAAAAAALLLLLGACSPGPGFTGGSVSPEINVKGLASDTSQVNVRVTGPGIDRSYTLSPSTSSLAMNLPAAEDVRFEIEAPNDNVGNGPVYSWGMARYADLISGQTTELDFVMGPFDTKILIPEQDQDGSPNPRIVQLDNMSMDENVGATPYELNSWNVLDTIAGAPYDIALDNQGRIWISKDQIITTNDEIVMFENITQTEYAFTTGNLVGGPVLGQALAFDRMNSYLYYTVSQTEIGRFFVSPNVSNSGSPQTINLDAEPEISYISLFGIAVDNEGHVYLAGADQQEYSVVFKLDPNLPAGERVVAKKDISGLVIPSNADLLVKHDHVYLSVPTSYKVVKLSKELQIKGSIGFQTDGTADEVGEFVGPNRFVVTTSDDIYIIDDSSGTNGTNRIIRFKSITGEGWTTFNPVDDQNDDVLVLYNPPT